MKGYQHFLAAPLALFAPFALLLLSATATSVVTSNAMAQTAIHQTELGPIKSEIVIDGLSHPWSMAFLPTGEMLITERTGQLLLVSTDANGNRVKQAVSGLPAIAVHGQGGLLDIALHPDFANNQLVYFSYSKRDDNKNNSRMKSTAVVRGRLVGNSLTDLGLVFEQQPKFSAGHHFGSRLVFDTASAGAPYLYITTGDRGQGDPAQDASNTVGTVIRVYDDGSIPADNPFVGQSGIAPEIYSFGHRNQQGAFLHPQTGELWTHEHGPQGGDELNVIAAGKNYGWPVITYGVNYGSGTKIGEGTAKVGMEQPIHYWVPSIAPSGMTYYASSGADSIAAWQGDVLVGSLKFQQLVRLRLAGDKVVAEERLFSREFGRIRDVRTGPDGAVYLLTDAADGKCIRLTQG